MKEPLFFDFETRSWLDLTKVGAPRYASDPSTGVNSLAWAVGLKGPIHHVDYYGCLSLNTPPMMEFRQALNECYPIVCHYTPFEWWVMKYVYDLEIPSVLLADTMALLGYYGYPRGLNEGAKALGCPILKDITGGGGALQKLMGGIYTPEDCPEDFERLYVYNQGDIPPMRGIYERLPALPQEVFENWVLDFDINKVGVPIDMQMVENAIALREQFAIQNDAKMAEFTAGHATTVNQTAKIAAWCGLDDCTADTVAKALSGPLTANIREVLELRQEAGLSSLAKYQKMKDYVVDGRLYEMHDWYGTHTGRPTGSGPQMLNLARSENPGFWAEMIAEMPELVLSLGVTALKEGLRGSIAV